MPYRTRRDLRSGVEETATLARKFCICRSFANDRIATVALNHLMLQSLSPAVHVHVHFQIQPHLKDNNALPSNWHFRLARHCSHAAMDARHGFGAKLMGRTGGAVWLNISRSMLVSCRQTMLLAAAWRFSGNAPCRLFNEVINVPVYAKTSMQKHNGLFEWTNCKYLIVSRNKKWEQFDQFE